MLSGDSLFVGDVARTDLAIEETAGRPADLRLGAREAAEPPRRLRAVAGPPGRLDVRRRGNEREDLLDDRLRAPAQRDAGDRGGGGVRRTRSVELGPQPPNFEKIVELNRGPLVTSGVEVPALYPHQVLLKREEGALLVDVRTDLQFDDVHIHGSICIPSFSSGFGSKLAWLADHDQRDRVHRPRRRGRPARGKLALAVGVRNIAGLLAGGMTNWRQERQPASATERVAGGRSARLAGQGARPAAAGRARAPRVGRPATCPGRCSPPGTTSWASPRASTRPADRGDLRRRCARGHRREPAQRHGAQDVIHVVDGGVPASADAGVQLSRAARHRPAWRPSLRPRGPPPHPARSRTARRRRTPPAPPGPRTACADGHRPPARHGRQRRASCPGAPPPGDRQPRR